MFSHYGLVISRIEYVNRSFIYEQWDFLFRDLLGSARDVYDGAACWTNALGFLNRLINVQLLVRSLRDCGTDPPFDFFEWLRIVGNIIVRFISDTLRWSFSIGLLDSAYPAYTLLEGISVDFIPYTARALVCLCKDLRILSDWMRRLLDSRELDCIGHQLANAVIGNFQTVVNFILDLLRLILSVLFSGSPLAEVRNILIGSTPGDVVIPNLSKVNIHERVNSAGVLLGMYLNKVFTVSYCTVTSEIDSMGNSSAVEPLYANCTANPVNNPQLFCIIGIVISAMDRLLRLQGTLLWHLPQILYETATQPPGPRYLTEDWFEVQWDVFFDTLRDPLPLRNYTLSLNFPTIIPGTNVSSILWPNDYLYGPPVNPDCHLLNNSRFGVPCEQCPEVAEVDGETCACETATFLDALTEPIINITFWKPWVCCAVPRMVRAGVAVGRFLVGTVVYIINIDRLGKYLADQNHYDIFFDEVAGTPYAVGGFLECLREIVLGFDHRLRCLIDLFVKPAKSIIEGFRTLTIAAVRLINNFVGTDEPKFEDYVCVTNATNCVDLERVLSHWRRPRLHLAYDPVFGRVEISTLLEPAFIDCVCYWLNFQVLIDFLSSPPSELPNFCCAVNYLFRLIIIEGLKLVTEIVLVSIETLVTIFDPSRPFTVVIVEWAACINTAACPNIGDMISDAEDLLNCPCEFLFEIEDILGPPKKFYCICDILAAAVQFLINSLRSASLFFSSIWDLLYCIANSWPMPHCGTSLHSRLTVAFQYGNTAADSLAGTVGGIGCILGLPWVGLKVDCLGTTYTWPLDYPTCQTSQNTFGPGQYPCTMSDRLSRLFYYIFQLFVAVFKFFWLRIEDIIDIGFGIFVTGHTLENSISQAIVNFFLQIGEPIFGKTNKNLTYTYDTATYYPWPNTTGVNLTALAAIYVNTSNSTLGNWTYQAPPSATVYGKTFNYTVIAGLNETTGLIQAIGLNINCLLGLPTASCKGPLLFTASIIDGSAGCLGDILIVAADALRDLYSVIIEFIGNGLLVLEYLFTNPSMLGDAIIAFIRSFFKIIFILVKNAQIVVDAIINIIVEVARFVLGNGVADMLKFFLTVISKVISVFISVIEFLLSPFINKRVQFEVPLPFGFAYKYDEGKEKYPGTLEEAFLGGYAKYSEDRVEEFGSWLNTSYWKMHAVLTEKTPAQGWRKRTTFSKQNDALSWSRISAEDFGMDQIQTMTDGFCKKTLTKLNDLKRFDGMEPSQEALWKTCFVLFSLPNELYAQSNGSLALSPDTFYNPATLGMLVTSLTSTFNDYMSYRSQSQGSTGAGGGTLTELFDVPPEIMQLAEGQATLHDMMTALTVDNLSQNGTNVQENIPVDGTFLESFQEGQDGSQEPSGSAINPSGISDIFESDSQTKRGNIKAGNHRGMGNNRFRKVPVSFVKLSELRGNSEPYFFGEKTCGVSFEKGFSNLDKRGPENEESGGFQYCIDDNAFYKGFALDIGYPGITSVESRDAFLKDVGKIPGGPFLWSDGDERTKRGLIDSSTGSAVDMNLAYNKLVYDNPSSPNFNPFFGTHLMVYTSLAGRMLLNISKYGTPVPVIDGKIAITHSGMNFVDYLSARGLDSDLNLAAISSYEDHELTETKESFLRLNSKGIYLSYLYTKNYTGSAEDPDGLGSNQSDGDQGSLFNLNDGTNSQGPSKRFSGFFFDDDKIDTENDPETLKRARQEKMIDGVVSWFQGLNAVIAGAIGDAASKLKTEEGESWRWKWKGPPTDSSSKGSRFGNGVRYAVESIKWGFQAVHSGYYDPNVKLSFSTYNDDLRELEGSYTVERFLNRTKKRNLELEPENQNDLISILAHQRRQIIQDHIFQRNLKQKTENARRANLNRSYLVEYATEQLPGLFLHLLQTASSFWSPHDASPASTIRHESDTLEYDESTGTTKSGKALDSFSWLEGSNVVVDPHTGYEHGPNEEMHVVFDDKGRYSLYQSVKLSLVEKSSSTPAAVDRTFALPSDVLFKPSSEWEGVGRGFRRAVGGGFSSSRPVERRQDSDVLNEMRAELKIGYYEYHYNSAESSKRCLGDTMWFVDSPLEDSDGRKSTFKSLKCYKISGESKDHPHQIKYGKTLKGKSAFQHRLEMLMRIKDKVMSEIKEKLDTRKIEENIKKLYVTPWMQKYRETIQIHGRVPTITSLLVAYDSFQRYWFNDDPSYAIPDSFLAELGHPLRADLSDDEINLWKKRSELSTGSDWEGSSFHKILGWDRKRNHFPPLIDVCLPKNISDPSSNETNCLNCTGCSVQDCHYCDLCYNCTLGFGGYYNCDECGACKVGPTAHCKGGCFQCTGCQAESSCFKCKLVQVFISGAFNYVNYCKVRKIDNDSSIVLVPLPNTTLYPVFTFNASAPAPSISNYGFTGFIFYLNDLFWYILAKVTGYYIYDMIVAYFTTTNIDPFDGSVGFLYHLRYNVPWPLIGRCNRDIHTVCTFGVGLRTALIVVSVIFLVVFVLIYLNFGILGMVFSFVPAPVLYVTLVASMAWHYNVGCLAEPFFSIFAAFGIPFLAFPILPECAMDEIFDLLNDTITRCSTWFPSALTTDGITCPDSYDVFVNITNCSQHGFYSLPTVIGYAGQRWIPNPQNFWLNDYLNRTCLVKGMCPFGFSWAEGILHPFFEHNYNLSFASANTTATLDACFYVTIWGVLSTVFYFIAALFVLFLLFELLRLLWETVLEILTIPPISWFAPIPRGALPGELN